MKEVNSKSLAIKNAKIAISSQLVILIIGVVKSLIIPMLISVESYAYWQTYLLYLPYIGLFYLGFNDGIYLRYGKYEADEIPFEKFRTAIRLFQIMLVVECLVLMPLILQVSDENKKFALLFVIFNIPIQGIYGTIIYLLQITNQIKKYSIYSMADKIIFLLLLLLFLVVNENSFKFLIFGDLISRFIVVIIMLFKNRNLFIGKGEDIKSGVKEFISNINIGISLMIASFLSMLFTGIGRMFVENFGKREEYAYYSFGMSLINILLICFTSIGMVMYPILKRKNKDDYGQQFNLLNSYFDIMFTTGLFAYFICYILVKILFIEYSPVLDYLNLFFGLAVFQGKINLLNNTFYKVLREEKRMLRDNVISVIMFVIGCIFARGIWTIAFVTFIIMAHRSIDSEIFLRKKMSIEKSNNIKLQVFFIGIFVITTSINFILGFCIYLIVYLIYFYRNRHNILQFINIIVKRR